METVTPKQVIESIVEAAKTTIAYGYDVPVYGKPPPADMQAVISYLIAPLLVDIIMDCNNFILTKRKPTEAATTLKHEIHESIDGWVNSMETATEFVRKLCSNTER